MEQSSTGCSNTSKEVEKLVCDMVTAGDMKTAVAVTEKLTACGLIETASLLSTMLLLCTLELHDRVSDDPTIKKVSESILSGAKIPYRLLDTLHHLIHARETFDRIQFSQAETLH